MAWMKFGKFAALSLAFVFAACGDDSSSSSDDSDSENISVTLNEVSGVSQKGPFLMGSKVQMFEISNGRSLNQSGKSFNGKISNDKGEFKIKGSKLCSQYVILEASGYYRNENTGKNSESELTLLAISNVSDRNTININLLTHLEYERVNYLVIQQKMKVDEAKKQAQKEILDIFYIDNAKFSNSEDLNIAGTNDEDGALLAISVLLQGDRKEGQFSELLTKFAIDMEEDGEWNDDANKNAIADWAAEIVHSGRIATIRNNVEKWQLSDIVPNFEKYINIFWWHTYGLGECSANREGEVLQNTNAQSTKYGTYYICKEGLWREATAIEYDTYQWKAETDGAVRLGNVIKTNCYVYEDQAWRNGNASDCSLGLRGCTALRQDTVGKGNDKVWYICDEKSWRNATTYEKDTFGWKDSTDGTIKKGNVTDTTYLFDGSAWRTRSDVEKKLGGCVKAIEDSVGTVDGKEYYICKSNNWVEASEIEYDTYRWAAGKDGEIKKGNITDNIYIFDKNAWRTADNIEAVLGGCVAATQDSLGKVDEFYYICKSNKWENVEMTILQLDTYKEKCSEFGQITHGHVNVDYTYFCNGKEWKLFNGNENITYGKLVDERDGQIYRTVEIDGQTWMAENLNYADSSKTPSLKGKTRCYDGNNLKCKEYGRLYTWGAAIDSVALAKDKNNPQNCGYGKACDLSGNIQGVCPNGWHLPSSQEWSVLFEAAGGEFTANNALKSMSGWSKSDGTDDYGFNGLPAGAYDQNCFYSDGETAHFWTSSIETAGSRAYSGDLFNNYEQARIRSELMDRAYSVRCIKDGSVSNMTEYDTYSQKCTEFGQIIHGTYNTDNVYFCNGKEWKRFYGNKNITYGKLVDERDNQVYRTVKIGDQTWMAENLNYADSSTTLSLKGRSWCYNNEPENCVMAGRLYTWAAAIDSVGLYAGGKGVNCGFTKTCSLPDTVYGICPPGWHLPNKSEWKILVDRAIDAEALKSQVGWPVNYNGNDEYGFSMLPGGVLYRSIGFEENGVTAFIWASSEDDDDPKSNANRFYTHDNRLLLSGEQKIHGCSIRCIKNE